MFSIRYVYLGGEVEVWDNFQEEYWERKAEDLFAVLMLWCAWFIFVK